MEKKKFRSADGGVRDTGNTVRRFNINVFRVPKAERKWDRSNF